MKEGNKLVANKIWYSEVQYVSGKKEKVIFANEEIAKDTFNKARYEQHDKLVYIEDSGRPSLINLNNVEKFSEPKEHQPEEE